MLKSTFFNFRFCSDSKYGDVKRLENEMKNLNWVDALDPSSSVTNFKDIKTYLQSHPEENQGIAKGTMGQMSLQDIKGHFEGEKRRFDDIQK